MLDLLVAHCPIPDGLIRLGIRSLITDKKNEVRSLFKDPEAQLKAYADSLKKMPIAIKTDLANEQHYEVPSRFYQLVLGKKLKYSACLWDKATNLDDAETEMLESYLVKAQIENGQKILDVGCGWGSFSLFAAERFKNSRFTAVSNSRTQKEYIDKRAKELGLTNLKVITANIVEFDQDEKFDRIVTVEMLEHMKNYQALFEKFSRWMTDEGKLFIHIFTHSIGAYPYEVKDQTDWMTKYFFEGGMMPSDNLFYHFQDDLKLEEHWRLNGVHYEKTSAAWLERMDANKPEIMSLFRETYGAGQEKKWFRYWRIFFMACEELWAYDKGQEWLVSHYLLSKKK